MIKLLSLLLIVLLVWLLIHLFSIAGIFISIIYLLVSSINRKFSLCIPCRLLNNGQSCPACGKSINKKITVQPKNTRSVFVNTFLLLLFTLLSVGFVLFEYKLLQPYIPQPASQSVRVTDSTNTQHPLGEEFEYPIEFTNITTPINSANMDITFDPNQLEIVDITTDGSFATVFVEKQINNTLGFARIAGGLPNPGYSGETGLFAIIHLKGKTAGLAQLQFLPTSMILANDGKGTNILDNLPRAGFIILPNPNPIGNNNTEDDDQVLGTTAKKDANQLHLYSNDEIFNDNFAVIEN